MDSDFEKTNFEFIHSPGGGVWVKYALLQNQQKKHKNIVYLNIVHKCGAKLVYEPKFDKYFEISSTSQKITKLKKKKQIICFERCYEKENFQKNPTQTMKTTYQQVLEDFRNLPAPSF